MSAEAVELSGEWAQPQYGLDDLKIDVAEQMGLHDGQRIAGIDARFLELYTNGRLMSSGVRLTCSVLGADELGGQRTWDMYVNEGVDNAPMYTKAQELASTKVDQRLVTWVGRVGFERNVHEPLPPIKQFTGSFTPPITGW